MAIQVLPTVDGGIKEVVRIVDEVIKVIDESG